MSEAPSRSDTPVATTAAAAMMSAANEAGGDALYTAVRRLIGMVDREMKVVQQAIDACAGSPPGETRSTTPSVTIVHPTVRGSGEPAVGDGPTITLDQLEAACRVWYGPWSWQLLPEDDVALDGAWQDYEDGKRAVRPHTCRVAQRRRMLGALQAALLTPTQN